MTKQLITPQLLQYYYDPNFVQIAEAIMAGVEDRQTERKKNHEIFNSIND